MKFGHLLKNFVEGDDKVCLNYKKLKKLIKAQKAHIDQGLEGGAPAEAASGAQGGASSDDEDMPGAPPARAAAAAATAAGGGEPGDINGGVAEEDREFIATLNEDLGNINAYFMEKEEEAVIRLRALEDRLAAAKAAPAQPNAPVGASTGVPAAAGQGSGSHAAGPAGVPPAELEKLRSEMVDFHGELVLLLHWSLVNYAAVAKILKKHDKLTGSRLRAPVLASVLHQPFLSTESISQLVKAAERHVQELTQLCGSSGRQGGGTTSEACSAGGTASAAVATSSTSGAAEEVVVDPEAELAGSEHVAIFKRTRAALHMLNDMQQHASTPSTLLPPQVAASDAAPDKKRRMGSEQPQQQVAGAAQQLQQQVQ